MHTPIVGLRTFSCFPLTCSAVQRLPLPQGREACSHTGRMQCLPLLSCLLCLLCLLSLLCLLCLLHTDPRACQRLLAEPCSFLVGWLQCV